ncbi:MAM domain-containing glycosylphosphatidylinositol anchor protein 2 [Crenichthys baileyi]|uniref:MAM domain-containing glycosylphosphatidylinositol anchor protein 2 n=1 Tax=Crenichthys baileyi TaxID=28760 RepID=A0AAV9SS85_9TELE
MTSTTSTFGTDPPTVEPVHMEVRQGLGRPVVMTCRVLRAHPSRVLRFEWLLSNRLLHAGAFDPHKDETEYTIRSLNREGWGEYTCNVINEAGAGKCTFQVTGKAYPPEFYYDTYSPLWQNRPRVYGFKLQWTQMNPGAVDRIVAYRLGIRQVGLQRWWEQEIPVGDTIGKGELMTHNLTELIKPESYEVRLTPITRFGEGDSTIRIITYSVWPGHMKDALPKTCQIWGQNNHCHISDYCPRIRQQKHRDMDG